MRKLSIIALIILFTLPSQAQRWKLKRYEAIAGIGTTNVFGDIGGYTVGSENWYGVKDIRISTTRPSFYLGARYRVRENMSAKGNIIYGQSYGIDNEKSSNPERGGEFTTKLVEISGQYEYYFLKEDRKLKSSAIFNRRGMINNYAKLAAYGFSGAGGIIILPNATVANPIASDEAINTMKVSGVAFVGLGIKYTIDSRFVVGFELGGRYALSDYVDGFSNPIYSTFNDIYYFGVASLNYKIRNDKRGRPILFR